MNDLEQYRKTEAERSRTADLLRLLPKGRESVLDVGARDGHFSALLTRYFETVVALDLHPPSFRIPGVAALACDARKLPFPDNSFDVVFCAEVLEHVPKPEMACRELLRVARHELVIGVPYRQDLRYDRTTCVTCGKVNPPWGHLNAFDEKRLLQLFEGARLEQTSVLGQGWPRTNPIATVLMELAGNPWGTYNQHEPCIHCGTPLKAPESHPLWKRVIMATAWSTLQVQKKIATPAKGNWIHVLFSKTGSSFGARPSKGVRVAA